MLPDARTTSVASAPASRTVGMTANPGRTGRDGLRAVAVLVTAALETGAPSRPLELITPGSPGLVYPSVGRLIQAVESFHRSLEIARESGSDDKAAAEH